MRVLSTALVVLALLATACPVPGGVCTSNRECRDLYGPDHVCEPAGNGTEGVCQRVLGKDDDAGTPGNGVAPAITSFAATPDLVSHGGTTTLSWTTEGALFCSLSGGGLELDVGLSGGLDAGVIRQTTTFTLRCSDGETTVEEQATVYVRVEVLTLLAAPPQIDAGRETRISWSTVSATSCLLVGPGGYELAIVGADLSAGQSDPISLDTRASFTLTCEGQDGIDDATIDVGVAAIERFVATPEAVVKGELVTLSWQVSSPSPELCVVTRGGAPVPDADFLSVGVQVEVDETSVFRLACPGHQGMLTQELDVPVLIEAFAPRQPVIDFDTAAWLEVTAPDVATCSIDGEDVTPNQDWTSPPLTSSRTFTLTCADALGRTATASADVQVRPEAYSLVATPAGPSALLLEWSASPNATCELQRSGALVVVGAAFEGSVVDDGAAGRVTYRLVCRSDPGVFALQEPTVVAYVGAVTDSDLADVDGASLVTGDVSLFGTTSADLAELAAVVEIGGDLLLLQSPALTSTSGLEQLRSLGGDLVLWRSHNLSLLSLPALERLDGGLTLEENDGLVGEQLLGLSSLGGNLRVINNPQLLTIGGIANVTAIGGGELHVAFNDLLDCETVWSRYCELPVPRPTPVIHTNLNCPASPLCSESAGP